MSNSRVIYISSNDKDASESKSNSEFVVYLKERVSVQQSNYAILKTMTIPNVFYNVRDSSTYGEEANNIFLFAELAPASTYAITIPEGQYLIQDYITALEAAMNLVLVSGTVAITQDPITGKLIFTCTGTQISIFSGANGNTSYELVGADEFNNTPFSANITLDNLPDLSGIQNVYIESREIAPAHGNDGSFGIINIVGQVNLSETPFGAYGHYESPDSELSTINYKNERNIQRCDIRVVSDRGNTLPVGNGKVNLSLVYFYD